MLQTLRSDQSSVTKRIVSPRKYKWFSGGRIKLAPSTKRNDERCTVVSGAIEQCLVSQQMCSLIGVNTRRYNLHNLVIVEDAMHTVCCQC